MKVYVTGASGFIGRRIVDHLVRKGHSAVALTRDPSKFGTNVPAPGVEVRQLDLMVLESIVPAIQDCDAGIHAAGIGPWANEKEMHELNVQASRHLAGSARRQQKLFRLVALTSAAVDEAGDTPYRRAKIGQEAALRSYGIDLTLLRPTLVVGPYGESKDLKHLVERLRGTKAFPLVGGGRTKIQPVDVDDVAAAAVAAVENKDTIGKILPLAGPEGGLEWREFVTEVQRRVKGVAPLRSIPRFPLVIASVFAALAGKGQGMRAALAYYGEDHLYSLAEPRALLGFAPRSYPEMLDRAFGSPA